jgi:glucokinase
MRASFAIGVDVGGSAISAGLVQRDGRVVEEETRETPGGGPFAVVDAVIESVRQVSGDVREAEVAGVGVGLPAQVDFGKQTVEFCTNLPLTGIDMRSLVMSRISHQVTVDNDGHTAAIGESRFGAGKDVRDFLMITVGTGVGGGVFLDGRPYRGARGLGGELGHMVVELDGPECPCGGAGHLEALVAGPAIAREAREIAGSYAGSSLKSYADGEVERITAATVIEAAHDGDEHAIRLLSETAHTLGRATVGLVNLLNPRLIILGGQVGASLPLFVERVSEAIAEEAMAGRRDVHVVPAELGTDAGVLGAAALAFDEYDTRQGFQP